MAKGFSMVELLVVFAIMILLTSGLVLYSRVAERQIIIFKDQIKIVSVLSEAKSLAFNSYGKVKAPCGYGVYFSSNPDNIILFEELSPSDDPKCSDTDSVYTSESEKFKEFKLDKTIKFSELGLSNIIFIPPNPIIVIDNDISKNEALIKIKTSDGLTEKSIKITAFGQITTQ